MPNDFERNVFINCPFDKDYFPLFRPLVFTIIYLGCNPRVATERFDSGEIRLQKITSLINQSKYSIHDLSRIQSQDAEEMFRMNMPFELGIDIGCRIFKGGIRSNKKCLVLEKERYRYQKALSDLSGSDIKNHNEDPEDLVREIRNWFVENGHQKAPSGAEIWEHFNEFMADFYEKRKKEGFKARDLEMMPFPEFANFIKEWKENN